MLKVNNIESASDVSVASVCHLSKCPLVFGGDLPESLAYSMVHAVEAFVVQGHVWSKLSSVWLFFIKWTLVTFLLLNYVGASVMVQIWAVASSSANIALKKGALTLRCCSWEWRGELRAYKTRWLLINNLWHCGCLLARMNLIYCNTADWRRVPVVATLL